jgi:hypothetical protein
VRLRNPSRDREAQSHAAKVAGPRFIGAIEAIKNVRQIARAYADSSVAKFCNSGAIVLREANENRPFCWGVLHSVINQNEEEAMQGVRIALDEKFLRIYIFEKLQPLCLG